MSSTMLALADPRKAVHLRSTERCADGTGGTPPEQPSSGTRLVDADCTELLAEFFSHPVACTGFVVTDRDGNVLDRHDCILDAIDRYNEDKCRTDRGAAHRVASCSGVTMKYRYAKKKVTGSRWESSVPA